MVVIRRESVLQRSKRSRLKRGLFSLGRFLRFLCLASLIPSLFFLRWYWGTTGPSLSSRTPPLDTHDSVTHKTDALSQKPSSRWWRQILHHLSAHGHAPQGLAPLFLNDWEQTFRVLPTVLKDNNVPQNYLLSTISEVAELYYCSIDDLVSPGTPAFDNFTSWAMPLLNVSLTELGRRPDVRQAGVHADLIQQEFVLQLLELYAQLHRRCDYSQYRYAPVPADRHGAAQKLRKLQQQWEDSIWEGDPTGGRSARLAIVVVVHRETLAQGRALLEAVQDPKHAILLHLDRAAEAEQVRDWKQLAQAYDNVVLLQFGSIVYKTDSVSMVNLRIMDWLVHDLKLQYDYHVTTSASSYPLVRHLGRALANRRRQVWLGETYLRGQTVYHDQSFLLKHKRLIYTRGPKLHKRLPREPFADLVLSEEIERSMMFKTNSGNHGIYAYDVVQELIASDEVKQLFLLSKYACCCCLEERNWIAALEIIGYGTEAREQAAVFQAWGGVDADCKSTMKNAVLSRNDSLCFKLEDATMQQQDDAYSLKYFGNQSIDYLIDAASRGILFARKFDFSDASSADLVRAIEQHVW